MDVERAPSYARCSKKGAIGEDEGILGGEAKKDCGVGEEEVVALAFLFLHLLTRLFAPPSSHESTHYA